MVVKGGIRGNGGQLANYLSALGDNERVSVFDIRGTLQPDDLKASLLEMALSVELSRRTTKGLYHAVINPAPEESYRMSAADWLRAADILEEETGFSGQKRVMVLHEKKGRIHAHVVWERYNHETERIIPNKHSRRAQNRARLRMEQELGLDRTPEKNAKRPERKKIVTDSWHKTLDGPGFIKALAQQGITVTRGQTARRFRAVDDTGTGFDLVKEIEGVRTKAVRERLDGLSLETEKQVIERIRDRQKIDSLASLKQEADRLRLIREEQIRKLQEQHQRQQSRHNDRGL
jgi:hypothetical protein